MRLNSPRVSRHGKVWVWLLIGLVVIIGIGAAISSKAQSDALAEGDKLYTAGKKKEAVAKYETGYPAAAGRKGEILERVVGYYVESGNTKEAEKWVEKGLDDKVDVSYTGDARQLADRVQRDREQRAAAKKAEQEQVKANRQQQQQQQAGQKSRVTRENYSQIRNGMNGYEVQNILGPGKEDSTIDNVETLTFSGKGVFIVVTFEAGRVIGKSISGD